jgi:hypothetical protein
VTSELLAFTCGSSACNWQWLGLPAVSLDRSVGCVMASVLLVCVTCSHSAQQGQRLLAAVSNANTEIRTRVVVGCDASTVGQRGQSIMGQGWRRHTRNAQLHPCCSKTNCAGQRLWPSVDVLFVDQVRYPLLPPRFA